MFVKAKYQDYMNEFINNAHNFNDHTASFHSRTAKIVKDVVIVVND